jgi:hypothetical protein
LYGGGRHFGRGDMLRVRMRFIWGDICVRLGVVASAVLVVGLVISKVQ